MGVRDETLQRVKRPFSEEDHGQQAARSRFNPPSSQGSVSAGAELGGGSGSGLGGLFVPPELSAISPYALQDDSDLAAIATRAFLEPMRRANRVPMP